MKRRRQIPIAVLMALGSACDAERIPFDEDRCSELRRHLVELQLRDIHPGTGVDLTAHREALNAALGDDFVPSCLSKLDEAQATCLIEAADQAAAQACNHTTHSPRAARKD